MNSLKRIPLALLVTLLAIGVLSPAASAQGDPEDPECGLPLLPPCDPPPPPPTPAPTPPPPPPPAPDLRGVDPASPNPLLGHSWFVDKTWAPQYKAYKRALRRIGVAKVRGFMLNVTHYDWTARNIRYGLEVSRRVGGKPFVISTHFNGRGPVYYRKRRGKRNLRINVHCHPRHRGLGIPPTTLTAHPKVDAYFWIGRPGYSGGSCNGGPLPVGTWWPARALALARNVTSQLGPQPGTRFGWRRGKFSLRDVAGDQLRR